MKSWMSARRVLVWCGLLALLGPGCKKIPGLDIEDFASCRDGATNAEVQENTRIANEYAGGIAADVQLSWTPVLYCLDFILLWGQTLGVIPSTKPVGWTFDAGTYTYGSDTAEIRLRPFLSEELGGQPAGTPITEDILELDSYLVGATLEMDEPTDTVTLTFESPGPLVELLGLGPAPTSPLVLDAKAREQIVASLMKIAIETDYVAYGVTQSTLVDYHAVSPQRTIAAIAAEGPLPVEIVAVNASRDELGQTLTTKSWEVERRGAKVDGFTTFTVSGGHFSYVGRLDFHDASGLVIGTLDLDCP